jgi:hypothetical protein
VTKSIIHILPIWRNNPNADFKSVADSPKLFKFVDELINSEKVWVYQFERAQDIMGILKNAARLSFSGIFRITTEVSPSSLIRKSGTTTR